MARKRILLVDDSETVLAIEEAILAEADYELRFAHDGDEAVEAAERVRPDLILMDVVMPRLNGLEACKVLRERPATRRIPIIMVTSREEADVVEAAYAAGCDDYITKPLTSTRLMAKVAEWLRLRATVDDVTYA